ncbi:ABC transporter permease [Ktedonosporobacter rubrisoli]|uniref:ABC transporter permease n=1 Tax=Ktedonosporobacter rubrisoli TaxID=2509675 RepID=UPI001F5D6BBB|nr:hypothetical protein [Ktedonosporobacter rubrisoli]
MKGLEGTATLTRLALRRERVMIPVWMVLIVVLVVGVAVNYQRLFPTELMRENFVAEMSKNLALIAFSGHIVSADLGALMVFKIGDSAYVLLALMVLLTIFRYTRTEEESGRQDLLSAGVVGRYAPLTASLIVACGASLLTGLLCVLGLLGLGIDMVGSIAFGVALAGNGLVFAAIAALVAQLSENTRTAIAIGALALIASYLIRFVADAIGQPWLEWLSPNGWSHLLAPFGDEQWGAAGLMLVATIIVEAFAYLLIARRDLGSGLLAPRPGPAGSTRLRSPLALAWRLQRGPLLGWAIAYSVIGAVCGAAAGSMQEFIRTSSFGMTFLIHYSGNPHASSADIFLEMIVITLGMVSVFYSAFAVLRLRSEEVAGHAELLLSTTVGRIRWIASHLVNALVGTVIILAAGGFFMGLVRWLSSGDVAAFPRVFTGALLHAPAAWVLIGAALLLFGIVPRFAVAMTWVVVLYVQLIGEVLGPIFLGPTYRYSVINALQPFHWVPRIASGGVLTATPELLLTGLSILLITAGLVTFQRRNVGS